MKIPMILHGLTISAVLFSAGCSTPEAGQSQPSNQENTSAPAPATGEGSTSHAIPAYQPKDQKPLQPATYLADVEIKPSEMRVDGSLTARFAPQDDKAYFHFYPNEFRADKKKSHETPEWEWIFGSGDGHTEEVAVKKVTVAGKPVPFTLQDTILAVPLPDPNAKEAEVRIEFGMTLPMNEGRMSGDADMLWLGNWLPILAVKDETGWNLDPYLPIGDPFYSETANYEVKARIPHDYQIASSGDDARAEKKELPATKQLEYTIKAPNMRDFAMIVMNDTFEPVTTPVGNTIVRTWVKRSDDRETLKKVHDTAVRSFEYFSKAYGTYPYREYDVVKTGMNAGGMEYPGVVYFDSTLFDSFQPFTVESIAHETAHQWFYGLIGNDEVDEPWVDESLTTYVTMSFLDSYEGGAYRARNESRLTSGKNPQRKWNIWSESLSDFPDMTTYGQNVYSRGATMLWELRTAWGEEKVNRVLKAYFDRHKYRIATGVEVVQAFTEATGADSRAFFEYWLLHDTSKQAEAQRWVDLGKQ
ncbi:M1 family metallopeptidase [Brevibacillus dissolubilis]|uniref:M1 family metallopeptidase n=1 Tax=Brevibacillus dissolubilis TaxID=1844116 RepID=UPI00111645A3|nr:M1 family metallopeptidase [Brevibacillus dissolubilis]